MTTYLYSYGVTLYDDFKIDSRIRAHQWIVENIDVEKVSIGTNDHLIRDGFKELKPNLEIDEDYMEKEMHSVYIINGWSESSLIKIDYPNILSVINHSNDHFVYMNNHNYLTKNFFVDEKFLNNKFELIKKFKGNGPEIFIFKSIK